MGFESIVGGLVVVASFMLLVTITFGTLMYYQLSTQEAYKIILDVESRYVSTNIKIENATILENVTATSNTIKFNITIHNVGSTTLNLNYGNEILLDLPLVINGTTYVREVEFLIYGKDWNVTKIIAPNGVIYSGYSLPPEWKAEIVGYVEYPINYMLKDGGVVVIVFSTTYGFSTEYLTVYSGG